MVEAGTTAQPLFGVPVPTEATGKVAPGSGGTLGQLPLLAPSSKPGSGQGRDKPTSWWGRLAMTSPHGLSQERLGLWDLASVWVVS